MENSEIKRFTFDLFVILLVTTICLSISFYFMAKGYAEFGGYAFSILISLVIVILLFYFSLKIHRARKKGQHFIKFFCFYIFFVIVSFAGNFNGLYSWSREETIVKEELDLKFQKLEELHTNSKVAFKEKYKITPEIDALVSDLRIQIINDNNGGCGIECRNIQNQITSKLGRDIRWQNPVSNPKDVAAAQKQTFDNYYQAVNGVDELKFLDDFRAEINGYKGDINKGKNAELIEKIVGLYKKRGAEAQSMINNSKQLYDETIKFENAEFGKLQHTLKSAYLNIFSPAPWIIAILALMVDLFVPLFIIFITEKEVKGSKIKDDVVIL